MVRHPFPFRAPDDATTPNPVAAAAAANRHTHTAAAAAAPTQRAGVSNDEIRAQFEALRAHAERKAALTDEEHALKVSYVYHRGDRVLLSRPDHPHATAGGGGGGALVDSSHADFISPADAALAVRTAEAVAAAAEVRSDVSHKDRVA